MMRSLSHPQHQPQINRSPRSARGSIAGTAAASLAALFRASLAIAAPAPVAAKPAKQAPKAVPAKTAADAPAKPPSGDAQPASANAPAKPATTQPATSQPGGRPKPVPAAPDPAAITDEMIESAISKGADWLNKQFDAKQLVAGAAAKLKEDESYAGGLDALAVYALMQCGLALNDGKHPHLGLKSPEMQAKIDALMKLDLSKGGHSTYAYGLRATALSVFLMHTPEFDPKTTAGSALAGYKKAVRLKLMDDAAWGVMATNDGSYTYVKGKNTPKDANDLRDYCHKLQKN